MNNVNKLSGIKGVLFDLEGVLCIGSSPIEGAIKSVERIRSAGFLCRFVTNTSTLSLASLQRKINDLGFSVEKDDIISAPKAAQRYLERQGDPICRLLLADDVRQDFQSFRQSDREASHIVVGDIGDAWSYRLLNDVFNCLIRGAKLIAIHKNRFWQTETGLQMDIGGFIDALEYASGVRATIIGKPSAEFFQIALDDLELKPSEAVMVGDDIDSDIAGGQRSGLRSILVKTGKYRQKYAQASTIQPDLVLDSIRDLPDALGC